MWQLADVFRGDWDDARGLGLALDMEAWNLFLDHDSRRSASSPRRSTAEDII